MYRSRSATWLGVHKDGLRGRLMQWSGMLRGSEVYSMSVVWISGDRSGRGGVSRRGGDLREGSIRELLERVPSYVDVVMVSVVWDD